jgi:hypothetical protein
LKIALSVEDLQPPVKNDIPTKNQHVADWTPDPVNNITMVNGIISDIKHYNLASGCQYPCFC